MREIELVVAGEWDDASVIAMVEEVAIINGLQLSTGSLKSYPGCTHWHFTRPGSKGTLEATWWPMKTRLWLKVHPGREGDWINSAIEVFRKAFP